MATQYYKRPDESTEQFNARVQTYSPSGAITSESLSPTESFDLATGSSPTKSGTGIIDSILQSFTESNKQQQQLEAKDDTFGNKIEELTRSLGTEPAVRREIAATLGKPEKEQALQTSNDS